MESNNSNQYHNMAKKQTGMRQRADFARNKERIGRLRKDNGRCNEKVSLKQDCALGKCFTIISYWSLVVHFPTELTPNSLKKINPSFMTWCDLQIEAKLDVGLK